MNTDTHLTVRLLGSGWAAVMMWFNMEEDFLDEGDGFWEPLDTGIGRYATREEAVAEATRWAEDEELEVRL